MRRLAPVFVLLLLSPAVAELLSGSTPLAQFFSPPSLLLELGLYGAGAILIRELTRWRGLGWPSILILGAAYGIVEEGLQIQSFFNVHHLDLGNLAVYGRALGVNWVWAEHLTVYHAVWSITIPILLTELLFPARRALPWLGRRGLRIVGIIFALDILAGFALVTLSFHSAYGYVPPLVPYLAAVALVCALGWLILRQPVRAAPVAIPFAPMPTVRAPHPWLLRLFSFGAAFIWFFIFIAFTGKGSRIPAPVTMLAGVILAWGVWMLIRQWSAPNRLWDDRHRLALATGPLLLTALFSLIVLPFSHAPGKNFTGQFLVGLIAILLLILFAWRVRRRVQLAEAASTPSTLSPWQSAIPSEQMPGMAAPYPPSAVVSWNSTQSEMVYWNGVPARPQ
jgi:hypothetical protein